MEEFTKKYEVDLEDLKNLEKIVKSRQEVEQFESKFKYNKEYIAQIEMPKQILNKVDIEKLAKVIIDNISNAKRSTMLR